MLNIENIHFLFSIWLLINLSIGMFLVNCEVTTLTRQLGQDLISGWFLQPSQIRWPFLHWKIFLGGTITITPRQTGIFKLLQLFIGHSYLLLKLLFLLLVLFLLFVEGSLQLSNLAQCWFPQQLMNKFHVFQGFLLFLQIRLQCLLCFFPLFFHLN